VVVGLKKNEFTPGALGVCVRTIKSEDKNNVIWHVKKCIKKSVVVLHYKNYKKHLTQENAVQKIRKNQ